MACELPVRTYKVRLIPDHLELLLCYLHPRRPEHFAKLNCSFVLRDPAIDFGPIRAERQHLRLLKKLLCIFRKTLLKGKRLLETMTSDDHGLLFV
jgi:hypothetical protein